MKILLCNWGSICEIGVKTALKKMNYEYIVLDKNNGDMDYDKEYLCQIIETIRNNKDINFVFSINYIPIVSRACNMLHIDYISLIIDCPSTTLYSKTVSNKVNHIFSFDKSLVEKFKDKCNIQYSALAADMNVGDLKISDDDIERFSCDVSFVGSLYTEKCKYYRVEEKLSEHTKGYINGIVAAQQNVYGYNFIEDSISEDWAESFRKEAELGYVADDYDEDIKALVSDLYIGYLCSEQERIKIVDAVSSNFNMDLWTTSNTDKLLNVNNRGIADAVTMMPYIFKLSKINLNITLKTIKTGIPQRVFDIMSVGGFVISNFQPDILDYFIPDEDIVLYESVPDLLNKIEYYLDHDEERERIAQNGKKKVEKYHSYESRIKKIIEDSNLSALKKSVNKYSIITPCYNAKSFIGDYMNSLLNQTYGFENLEIILVDDASSDGTVEVLKEFENKYPDNITLILCDNNGKQGTARNIGLSYATGDYISFIDIDDFIHSKMFDFLNDIVIKESPDIVQFRYIGKEEYSDIPIDVENNINGYKVYDYKINSRRDSLLNSYVLNESCTTKIYNRVFLNSTNSFFAEGVSYEEPLFTYPLKFYANRIVVTDAAPYYYRHNPNGTTFSYMQSSDKIYEHIDVQYAVWNHMKKSIFFEEYYNEIELYFIHSLYVESVYFMSYRNFEFTPDLHKYISEIVLSETPNFINNPYWTDDSLELEYLIAKMIILLDGKKDNEIREAYNIIYSYIEKS